MTSESASPAQENSVEISVAYERFVEPPPEARPMMRWWWFGPDLDRDELVRELTAMRDAGIGGVEVAFTYPLSRVEHPFLSPAFLGDLRFAAETARELGLRFDMTLGSGWSYGGPHITDATAARALRWDVRDIGGLPSLIPLAPEHPGDEFVAAFVGDGSLQEPPIDFERVAAAADGGVATLEIPSRQGPRVLVVVWSAVTGQQVKRAASGAEGPVLDHYSAVATRVHLRAVGDPLLDAVPAELLGSVFCDSLEVYGSNWTTALPAEFELRHGHPLIDSLWMLRFDSATSAAFRAEYYETLGELYEENFLDVTRAWAAEHGVPFRVQSYGAPPAGLRSYRHADLTEGEGWGWRGIPQTRWASSAAHHDGRTIVSSETWTWVHSPSFRATPLDLKGEAHEHFLLGINKLIGHGWPYSAPDARGLGWFFYASGALDDRNTWWAAMPPLTRYLSRMSSLLQLGEPVRDVLLYVPAQDVYPQLGPEQGGTLDLWRQSRDRIGPDIPAAIRDAGFDFDLVDDETLGELAVRASMTVVVPSVSRMPERTASALRAVIDAGGVVLTVVDSGAEASPHVPGDPVASSRLRQELLARRDPDLTLVPHASSVGFVHRRLADGDVYVVINTGSSAESFVASPRSIGDRWQLWCPDNGDVVADGTSTSPVEVRLAPYQAVALVTGDALARNSVTTRRESLGHERALASGWTRHFLDGRETGEAGVELPHVWEWERTGYAGRVEYRIVLDSNELWPQGLPERVVLDFGRSEPESVGEEGEVGIRGSSYRVLLHTPVGEIVSVDLNGESLGVLYAPPYEVDIASALVVGSNELRLVVANVTASSFADEDVRGAVDEMVALSRGLYGQRFRMQDLDSATAGIRSGLLDVPRLRWV